jgi:hypothetical protein
MCHTKVLADGTVVKGAQSSLPLDWTGAWLGSRNRSPRTDGWLKLTAEVSAAPWAVPLERNQPHDVFELLSIRWAMPPYVIARGNRCVLGSQGS